MLDLRTVNGSKVTYFDKEVGTLEKGKRADIVLVNLERINEPYLNPDTNPVDALLYRGKGIDVDTVIIDGEVVLRDKKFTKIDKAEVIDRFKETLNRPIPPQAVQRGELGRNLLPYIENFFEGWELDKGSPHYFYNESA